MKLFLPELEISDDEGFTPEKDIFGRAKFGEGLTNLVSRVTNPLVIAVDGQWGSGKTVFLKMWAGELRKKGFPVIYFDAFAHDYFDDPFMAIAGEIIALADENTEKSEAILADLKEKAVSTGKILARAGLKVGVRLATLGAAKAEDFEGLGQAVSGEIEALVDTHIGELITSQKKQKSTLTAFQTSLSRLPSLLGKNQKNDTTNEAERSLIFIIDELDRCRPEFALQLLERMKHFFSVPNVHFVLGTNLNRLSQFATLGLSPQSGEENYLNKFVNVSVTLSDVEQNGRPITVDKFVQYLVSAYGSENNNRNYIQECGAIITKIATLKQASLRTVKKTIENVVLVAAFTPENYWRNTAIVACLCYLKIVAPNLFQKAKSGQLRFAEVQSFLGFDSKHAEADHLLEWTRDWWMYASSENIDEKLEVKMSSGMWKYSFSNRFELLKVAANDLIDRFKLR